MFQQTSCHLQGVGSKKLLQFFAKKTPEDGNSFAETYVGSEIYFIHVNNLLHALVDIRLMTKCNVVYIQYKIIHHSQSLTELNHISLIYQPYLATDSVIKQNIFIRTYSWFTIMFQKERCELVASHQRNKLHIVRHKQNDTVDWISLLCCIPELPCLYCQVRRPIGHSKSIKCQTRQQSHSNSIKFQTQS